MWYGEVKNRLSVKSPAGSQRGKDRLAVEDKDE